MDPSSTFAYCSSQVVRRIHMPSAREREFVEARAEALFESGLKIAGLNMSES